jgi:DNA polymerase-3 subunit epsilon
MRQVILDIETTGLEPAAGHRIIEIGCVELVNRRLTQRRYHQYLWPDREIDAGALEVHGITTEFLKESPRFADIVEEFVEFVRRAEVIIHNAPFDAGFINHELKLLKSAWGVLADYCAIIDTLVLAREIHPGQKNSLDALCKRYQVDHSQRDLHGALLDAEILAEVYLAMTGGQTDLLLEEKGAAASNQARITAVSRGQRAPLRVITPSGEELALHGQRLQTIDKASGGRCLWQSIESTPA